MMNHPKARQDDLVVQELFEELVVYDLARDQVHSLNPTAAQVWQGCDGQTSPDELAGRLSPELTPAQAEELVWLALDRLEKARLLEQKVTRPAGLKISRRRALRTLGISALLPVVASLVAPTAAQAQTCVGTLVATLPLTGICANYDINSHCDGFCQENNFSGGYGIACVDDNPNDGIVDKIDCCCIS